MFEYTRKMSRGNFILRFEATELKVYFNDVRVIFFKIKKKINDEKGV